MALVKVSHRRKIFSTFSSFHSLSTIPRQTLFNPSILTSLKDRTRVASDDGSLYKHTLDCLAMLLHCFFKTSHFSFKLIFIVVNGKILNK